MASSTPKHQNALANERSPYLQQHAQNPVNWFPWKDEYLNKAKKENKLLIISIGYAACHWCHVMEHESFEDEEVAKLMNRHFINLKVDREERPDIDHVYMQALQILTGQGGWPLNIVALPDGRPVWGGTYFRKTAWMDYLSQLTNLYQNTPEKLLNYAQQLADGMQSISLQSSTQSEGIKPERVERAFLDLKEKIDPEFGGMRGAPKFMMPTLLDAFLNIEVLNEHAHFSLEKMALGGLFDVVGGGFSRYAVDHRWHIPHFEKMGYDNGQLLATYSRAFRENQNPLYKEVVNKTVKFLTRELYHSSGGFFASLDADSLDQNGNLVEGAFYVWNKNELRALDLLDNDLFKAYYGIDDSGYWENDKYVFFRKFSSADFIYNKQLDSDFIEQINVWEKLLFNHRSKRTQPRLDNKIICSWNAMIGRGLLEAWTSFEEKRVLEHIRQLLLFFPTHFHREDGGLFRLNNSKVNQINGFLEDYAHLIAFYIDAYENFFDATLLDRAAKLVNYCLVHFTEKDSPLFLFSEERNLVVDTREVNDNVIPSSNALMTENLLRLATHLGQSKWSMLGEKMLKTMGEDFLAYPRAHSTWLRLYQQYLQDSSEVVVLGPNAFEWIRVLKKTPQHIRHWAASETDAQLPLLKHRFQEGKTRVYLCKNSQCGLPIDSLEEAKKKLMLF